MDWLLHTQLAHALECGDLDLVAHAPAANPRDLLCTLLSIYECSPTQGHPVIEEMRCRFERWLVDALDVQVTPLPGLPSDAVEAVTVIAQRDNDGVFDWLADGADSRQMVCFLMVEGGPDVGMPSAGLPLTALFRSALRGLLATNRNLRPEQLGALGVGHLQAGPRRRRVLTGLKRLGAPADALPMFTDSAYADARYGEEWIDRVLRPVADDRPEWGQRIVRGALWHSSVNARLFRDLHELIATRDLQTA